MKLQLVVTAVYAMAFQTMVHGGGSCSIGSGGLTDRDKEALRKCHDNYDSWTWDGMNCGGKGWFRGHDAGWQSPNDCKDLCEECIEQGITAGAKTQERGVLVDILSGLSLLDWVPLTNPPFSAEFEVGGW